MRQKLILNLLKKFCRVAMRINYAKKYPIGKIDE
jgi:hypothetical protein